MSSEGCGHDRRSWSSSLLLSNPPLRSWWCPDCGTRGRSVVGGVEVLTAERKGKA